MNLNKIIKILRVVYIIYNTYTEYLKMRKRRWWVRELNFGRDNCGFFIKSIKEMQARDGEHFIKATRFNVKEFKTLLNLLNDRLRKHSRREPISAELRLAVTLMYLAHGGSIQVLDWPFKIGISPAREIIIETCDAIWNELSSIYLSQPNQNEWEIIARRLWNKRQMPNCLGAIDGKHIHIKCPPKGGSMYFNYKKYHSIVLLAACDDNYCFTAIDVGSCGSKSDGGVFANSGFGKQILRNVINIPETKPLPETNIDFPYDFVADAAFPLKENIMRPFPGRHLSQEEEVFNKRLARARSLIENSFGILACRWRALASKMNCSPKNATKIVLATVVLHNMQMLNKSENYCPEDYVDVEVNDEIISGLWQQEDIELQSTRILRINRGQPCF